MSSLHVEGEKVSPTVVKIAPLLVWKHDESGSLVFFKTSKNQNGINAKSPSLRTGFWLI